jgi:hypothetical protein
MPAKGLNIVVRMFGSLCYHPDWGNGVFSVVCVNNLTASLSISLKAAEWDSMR